MLVLAGLFHHNCSFGQQRSAILQNLQQGSLSFYQPICRLTVGAFAWPMMADKLGRKWILTNTLVLMGMCGLVGAGMPAFTGLCVVGFVIGIALAGNQAVDAILLLESIPASHQYLVAMQGVFWGLGQLVAYAVGW